MHKSRNLVTPAEAELELRFSFNSLNGTYTYILLVLALATTLSFIGRTDNFGMCAALVGLIYMQKYITARNYMAQFWVLVTLMVLDVFALFRQLEANSY